MIFVDDVLQWVPRNEKVRAISALWCHLTTDGEIHELLSFADQMGIPRERLHNHPTLPHFDLTPEQRVQALDLGAVYKSAREQIRAKRLRDANPRK
jgi:hypothetical protein